MLNLSIYSNIYADCQKLQAEWLDELKSFYFSNRADFNPSKEQRLKFKEELNALLDRHLDNTEHYSADFQLGMRLHFEARILPFSIQVSKQLHIYYSPETNTLYSFIKVLDATIYDQLQKQEINLSNISEDLIFNHIKAVNSMNANPFNIQVLNELLKHYLEELDIPLQQAKLPAQDQFKGLSEEDEFKLRNMHKFISSVKSPSINVPKATIFLEKVRESQFSFSKNSWEKADKREDIGGFIQKFTPEEQSSKLVIVLPDLKQLVKSNTNNLLSKIGMIYKVTRLSGFEAEQYVVDQNVDFNEAFHVKILYRMSQQMERLQFIIFDKIATKEQGIPLGGIGFLYEIMLSHCFRNYNDENEALIFDEVPLTATFNPQIFTRTLFNNSCLSSPFVESVESIQSSMHAYINMYQHFFHHNDIKDMAKIYANFARIPDIILNRENYTSS